MLDASAAAMRGDVLEGLRRALKALGRTRLVGAGPTTASFDGSAGVVDAVAGDLYLRAVLGDARFAGAVAGPERSRLSRFAGGAPAAFFQCSAARRRLRANCCIIETH